jgi:hypothetical protein
MDYEKLGAFYLGRRYDFETDEVQPEPILYDAKDLTTHAVCVGMTGSGKTGLGVVLLEEALIDGIPVIAIDPKGDLGNLMLTFPKLRPEDFEPWIDEGEAARAGRTKSEHARFTADLWKKGLGKWDQKPARISKFAKSAERTLYTPGSRVGNPISVLKSFAAPAPAVAADDDALRERILSAASGLLGLLGIDADPLRSREHILISTLLEHAWRDGRGLDIPTLIHQIQSPPMERIGVMDIDSFFPSGDRFELAMTLNNLVASPGFDAWTEGDPLDIGKLLHTADGRPRLSILSIAHLSEAERMFFVTQLLNEVVAWMRAQPGSRSLRAILYMDEVFGYFPPTANPPSKKPMLTLLKQARAYGLGVVLATQNPVDLDYKGLSNAGTWFLGRLQTERDKARVLEGLEGASSAASARFDRAQMERTLAGLSSRVFVMNNVHEDEPVVFQTRWALSYLGGPLARDQIRELAHGGSGTTTAAAPAPAAKRGRTSAASRARAATEPETDDAAKRPTLPPDLEEAFLPITVRPSASERIVYRPFLAAKAMLHYARATAKVDEWQSAALITPLTEESVSSPWAQAIEIGASLPDLDDEPEAGASFAGLPRGTARAKNSGRWSKMLATQLYRQRPIIIIKSRKPKALSRVGESEGEFRGRLQGLVREARDLAVEKLRRRFAPKLVRMQERIRKAEMRVDVQKEQYSASKQQTAISLGATIVGALFGRKLGVGSVGRAATTARGASRAARERSDVARAEEKTEILREQLQQLEADFEGESHSLTAGSVDDIATEEIRVTARKSDTDIEELVLLWTPWRIDGEGIAEPAYEPFPA